MISVALAMLADIRSSSLRAALVVEDWGVIEIGLAIFARDYDAVINRMLLPYTKPKDAETREAAKQMIKARLRPVRVKSA